MPAPFEHFHSVTLYFLGQDCKDLNGLSCVGGSVAHLNLMSEFSFGVLTFIIIENFLKFLFLMVITWLTSVGKTR